MLYICHSYCLAINFVKHVKLFYPITVLYNEINAHLIAKSSKELLTDFVINR